MHRKELVAMFMESPFYFDMILQERLKLVQEYESRLTRKRQRIFNYAFERIIHEEKNDNLVTKIVVGYFPPEKPAYCRL